MIKIKHMAMMVILVSAMLTGCAGMTLAPHTPYYDLKSECRNKHEKIHPMIEALQRKHQGAFHVSSSGTYNVNVQVSSYRVGNTTYYNSSSNVTKIPSSVSGSTVHFWKKDDGRIRAVEVYTEEPFNQQETFIDSACVNDSEYEEIKDYKRVGKTLENSVLGRVLAKMDKEKEWKREKERIDYSEFTEWKKENKPINTDEWKEFTDFKDYVDSRGANEYGVIEDWSDTRAWKKLNDLKRLVNTGAYMDSYDRNLWNGYIISTSL